MFAEERQLKIAELVAARNRVTVTELADLFTITQETVRRDLATMESARTLRRVHGGAVAMDRLSMSEPSLGERASQRREQKARIADAAATLIPSSRTGSIILDAGTTTALLADRLSGWTPASAGDALLVITNAVPIAYKLSGNPEIQLEILGGRVRGLTSAVVGRTATEQLEALRPDIAFIGANGVHAAVRIQHPGSGGSRRENRHCPRCPPCGGAGRFVQAGRGDAGPLRLPGRGGHRDHRCAAGPGTCRRTGGSRTWKW